MNENKSVIGLNLLRFWDDRGSFEELARPIGELLANGTIKPFVGKVFPMNQAPEAHRFFQERKSIGKVVLTVP